MITIPPEIAAQVPKVSAGLRERERRVIDFCQSSDFSVSKLSEVIKKMQ